MSIPPAPEPPVDAPSKESAPSDGSAASRLPDILVRIVRRRAAQLEAVRAHESWTPAALGDAEPELQTAASNRFLAGLTAQRGSAVIAEVKMGSPSLGNLAGRFDPLEQARAYARGGAAALSVVVEPDFFYGSYELLGACTEASGLPAIAKDFVVDPLQLYWAQRAGASAVLLIAALYTPEELRRYARMARALGLVPLIETHDLGDLSKLQGGLWELVGVNNRDLRTFQVELTTSLALLPSLPTAALKVAESGIHEASDLEMLGGAGFDAYLIGESLLTSGDPVAKLHELRGTA